MRKLLLLALLLCKCIALIEIRVDLGTRSDDNGQNYITDDIVALGTRQGNYDYDENDKRHSLDDRRGWRKKALQSVDKEWDERRRHDYEAPRYDELEGKSFGERRDPEARYRHRYEDVDKLNVVLRAKSNEQGNAYL